MSQAPSYFVDHKRGEVNELKVILRSPKLDKDQFKKREVIKKVLAYMTLGIDVSRLFSEMIMAASTKDIVQKKMVYLYLCTYAEQKADLAILAINTLQKDTRDEDPMVRGLSLRSLCSLRLPNLAEYVMLPIRTSLSDASAYVRKTAAMGCAKLYRNAPSVVKESDIVDILYNMLKDKDPLVITSVIDALNEVLSDEGGMVINQQIVLYLLNRIKDFDEWGQCRILDVTARYTPVSNDEMFDVMNLLEDRLKHANTGVVLATTKIFLHFTVALDQVHQEVYKRLKAPLLTLMSGGASVELPFTVLSHVAVLVRRAPHIFADSYKHFFCRFNDESCVKLLKLKILTNLAVANNYTDIVNEFAEYVTDVDVAIARSAIRGIGHIAIKIDASCDIAIGHLLSFLELQTDYICSCACVVLQDVLRKYPERYGEVIPAMQKTLKVIDEEDGKCAVVWMIGEFGDTIPDAPYILETLIDSYDEEPATSVRLELLTATMKLFFKRPPELQAMLGRLLEMAIEDTQKVDVRTRALFLYRLLRYDVHEAARIINCEKVVVDSFVDAEDAMLQEQIFQEFNTLSVVYNLPAEKFIRKPKSNESDDEEDDSDDEDEEESDEEEEVAAAPVAAAPVAAVAPAAAPAAAAAAAPAPEIDLLGDFFGSGGDAAPAAAPAAVAPMTLQPGVVVDAPTFQSSWGSLTATPPVTGSAQLGNPANATALETVCAQSHISTMASGAVGNSLKLYLYASSAPTYAAAPSALFFVEIIVDTVTGALTYTIKSAAAAAIPAFQQLMLSLFARL